MHRIDSYGATEEHRFTEGDPVIPVPPTEVSADWLNSVQEEIAHVIEGVGTPLLKTDDGQLLKAILALIALRGVIQAGMPIFTASSKLEKNCAWPDGSLLLFSDWPDLTARYEAGYIAALAAGTPSATISQYPGKWVAHASGLYLPNLGGLFPRAWTPTQLYDVARALGSLQGDAIRNLVGDWRPTQAPGPCRWNSVAASGPFRSYDLASASPLYAQTTSGNTGTSSGFTFDASLSVPTAAENRPVSWAQPVQIYLGRYKTEV